MATSLGRNALLAVSTDGGTTYNNVARVTEVSLSRSQDEEEFTSHDDSGDRVYAAGHRSREFSFSAIYDEGDTGQDACKTSYTAGTTYYWRFRPTTGSANDQFIGQGFVTSLDHSGPLEGFQGFDGTVRISGALTESAQP